MAVDDKRKTASIELPEEPGRASIEVDGPALSRPHGRVRFTDRALAEGIERSSTSTAEVLGLDEKEIVAGKIEAPEIVRRLEEYLKRDTAAKGKGGEYKAWEKQFPKWVAWTEALRALSKDAACAPHLQAMVRDEAHAHNFALLVQQADVYWRDRKIEWSEHKEMTKYAADLGLSLDDVRKAYAEVAARTGHPPPDFPAEEASTAPEEGSPELAAIVAELRQWPQWIKANESHRIFSEGDGRSAPEKMLARGRQRDVRARAERVLAKWKDAEARSRELRDLRAGPKFTSWLRLLADVTKASQDVAAKRIASYVEEERWQRFRAALRSSVRDRYENDRRIDWREWDYLAERAKEFLYDDKDTAQAWILRLCRDVTGNAEWTPPENPDAALRAEVDRQTSRAEAEAARRLEAEQRARESSDRDVSRETDKPTSGRGSVADEIAGRAEEKKRQPRLLPGAVIGMLFGLPLALLLGGVVGNSCSSHSRMALAEARAPLVREGSPDVVRVLCGTKADRAARTRELADSLRLTAGAVHPASAAASVNASAASCGPATKESP